ncbi:hypothetical protein CANMA_002601 [Candida margitis]|uniref:uncharacterized protein n=1 Tax=Candida margitis TaxID=1775924 RepID=UPI002227EB84|nr:uncharacterized protein CANMA_002601 [Candida margitis]KAI5968099.1 hypothetical protein CANMA_002601 [Candida margitis]
MLRLSANLSKVRLTHQVPLISTHNFSTTPFLLASPRQKEGKSKQILKRKVVEKDKVKKSTGLTHYPFKDAVQHLNLEKLAPPMDYVEPLTKDSLTTSTITVYPTDIEEKLRTFQAFKKFQHHEMFRNPVSLTTSNTVNIYDNFVKKLTNESKTNRKYIDGIKGSGKSTLVNQALALALQEFQDEVVILHLHSADILGNGSSDYFKNNKLGLYQQPMVTKRWLRKILAVNKDIFQKLKLTQDVKFYQDKQEISLKAGENTLYDYLSQNREINKVQPTMSFQFFIDQLKQHSKTVPIILSIDNFNAMADFSITQYRSPDFKPVHISEFELGDFILRAASGELSFDKGGVLLAKSCDFAPARKTTHVAVYPNEEYDPFMKYPNLDMSVTQRLVANGGIEPVKVAPLTKEEVRALLSFWRDQQVLITRQDFHKQEFNDEQADIVDEEFDPEAQFEKLVQSSFVVSQGNPYGILKQNLISY